MADDWTLLGCLDKGSFVKPRLKNGLDAFEAGPVNSQRSFAGGLKPFGAIFFAKAHDPQA